MPARPLFWLTIFFMPGISAGRLYEGGLPDQTHCFAFAVLVLTSVYVVVTLWFHVLTLICRPRPVLAVFEV